MPLKKPRSGRESRASTPRREPYERLLIVCEGSKTEPNYFNELRNFLRLSSANIAIYGKECGSSPTTVVQFAVDEFQRDGDFDRVFCVFDRDSHPDFDAAYSRCRDLRKKKTHGGFCQFVGITSSPCFEFWLLLHFQDSDAPIVGQGRKSSGDVALSLLRKYIPTYGKGMRGTFEATREQLPVAAARCVRINKMNHANPFSRVVDLLRVLFEVRQPVSSPWQEELDKALGIRRENSRNGFIEIPGAKLA